MPYLNPLGPQRQLAPVGPVPYNVVDGVNLRDQMMMSAKRMSESANMNPQIRLPRTNGKWEGIPANGKWYSDNPAVISITNGEGVKFKNGRPDFTPWSKGQLNFKPGELNGSDNDFKLVYKELMKAKGFKSQNQAKKW